MTLEKRFHIVHRRFNSKYCKHDVSRESSPTNKTALVDLVKLYTQLADAALAAFEAWMDKQPLSRSAQPPDKLKELSQLTSQAQVTNRKTVNDEIV